MSHCNLGWGESGTKNLKGLSRRRDEESGRVLANLEHSSLIIVCYQADKAEGLVATTTFKKKHKKTQRKKALMGP